MHVLRNVKGTTLTIARDAHKHAAIALRNVEVWHDGLEKPTPFFFRAVEGFFLHYYDHHS
jgi:hypothetical protein